MAVDKLKVPLGQRAGTLAPAALARAVKAALSRLQLLPVLAGLAISALAIFAVVVNQQPGAHRGEPVVRLALENATSLPQSEGSGATGAPDSGLRQTLAPDAQERRSLPLADDGEMVIIRRNEASSRKTVSPPLPALMQDSPVGPLPVISNDGLAPMEAYARPASIDMTAGAPARIALIVGGLGLHGELTSRAISELPAEVSLAFAPYSDNLEDWAGKARGTGHEYFLQLPLEPFDYPDNDPGPHTLLTSLRNGENMQRLRWLMGRLSGYVGVINHMGARFTADESATLAMLKEVQSRGLMYVDDGSSGRSLAPGLAESLGQAHVAADMVIDARPEPQAIGQALAELEALALERGQAVGTASILPVTLDSLAAWVEQLENKGIVLVPASSLGLEGQQSGL